MERARHALFIFWMVLSPKLPTPTVRRVSLEAELGKLQLIRKAKLRGEQVDRPRLQAALDQGLVLAGTAIVPLCDEHHNKTGEVIKLKETYAILDLTCALDLRGMEHEAAA